MSTTTQLAQRDLVRLLRGVESTPSGDLRLSERFSLQQAEILKLLSPTGQVTDVLTLADTVGIPISLIEHLPVRGIAFPAKDGWHIHISESLAPTTQLRVALHELKHIIDHPLRAMRDGGPAGFSDADYEHLADFFADCVLADYEP